MSIIDRAVAAVTPPESQEAREKARDRATECAQPGDWLSVVLDHHRQIEAAFAAVKSTDDAGSRVTALKKLGVVLTGHAIAEESVLYPGLAQDGEKGHADMGYTEQAMVKMQMAQLESLVPMSQDFLDKLEHIRGAVAHHMYEEEGTWFPELKQKASAEIQTKLTKRFVEEFDRYVGRNPPARPEPALQSRSWVEA